MFRREYKIRGEHADKVRYLVATTDVEKLGPSSKIIRYGHDVLVLAPLIAASMGLKSQEKNLEANIKPFEVPVAQVMKRGRELETVLKLILLTEKSLEMTPDERIDYIYRSEEADLEEKEALYHSYLLGGIDFLVDNLTAKASRESEYVNNIISLIDEFSNKYIIEVDDDELSRMGIEI